MEKQYESHIQLLCSLMHPRSLDSPQEALAQLLIASKADMPEFSDQTPLRSTPQPTS